MLQPHSYQPPEDGVSPKEVRILDLRVEPWPDNPYRIRVHLQITPFQERPNLEVVLTGKEDHEVASITVVESIDDRMTFTMHIRGQKAEGVFTATASVLYPEIGAVDQKAITFELHEASGE